MPAALLPALLMLGLLLGAAPAVASAFDLTYGGRVVDAGGRPVDGPVSLQISFFAAETGGTALNAAPLPFADVPLANGVFQVTVSLAPPAMHALFGDGSAGVWIEVTDATHGRVFPRQRFTAVPYALRVPVDGQSVVLDANGALKVGTLPTLALAAGTNTVTLVADPASPASFTLKLPVAVSPGYLATDASGNLTWDSPSSGGDMFRAAYDNPQNGKVDDSDKLGGNAPGFYTDASNITAGLLADGRIAATIARDAEVAAAYAPLAHAHGNADLTALDAGKLTGSIDDARIPGGVARDAEVAAAYAPLSHSHGNADLTALDAAKLTGTVADARFSAYGDLSVESKIGTGAAQVAAGDHTHAAATGAAAGLMSATDKTKLDTLGTAASISGSAITGGTITAFASTGIDDNAAATAMTLTAAGDVGIGVVGPTARLHVMESDAGAGVVNEVARFETLGLNDKPYVTIGNPSILGEGGFVMFDKQNGRLELGHHQGTTAVSVKSDGNVGILNTNPIHALDVTGNVRLSGDLIQTVPHISSYSVTAVQEYNSATWTGVHNVVALSDRSSSSIARTNSTLTFAKAGLYFIDYLANNWGTNNYLGLRLRRTNGAPTTLLQRTSYSNSGTDMAPAGLRGLFTVAAGDTVELEYVFKSGSSSTWSVSNPLDGESMVVAELSIWRIQ